MSPSKVRIGARVSVPKEKVLQSRPWEEPYGTIVSVSNPVSVSVRLDGECATIISVARDELEDE